MWKAKRRILSTAVYNSETEAIRMVKVDTMIMIIMFEGFIIIRMEYLDEIYSSR